MPRKKKPVSSIGGTIPIEIGLDGKLPEPLTPDYIQQVAGLAKNPALLSEVRRFIGEKIKDWMVSPESSEFLQAQIYGISDFYQRLKQYEAMARDGISNDTIVEDLIPKEELE